MKESFELVCERYPQIMLRTVSSDDQEKLRLWKNQNRDSFFFKGLIAPEDQARWFAAYEARDDDFMFMVHATGLAIGCMAFRLRGPNWDIYNVILGDTTFAAKGYMSQAMHLMSSFAHTLQAVDVTAQVLISNPALRWYYRNGFRLRATYTDYVEIVIDRGALPSCVPVKRSGVIATGR